MSNVSTATEQNAWAALRSYRQGSKKAKNRENQPLSGESSKSQQKQDQASICCETRIKPFTFAENTLPSFFPKVISNIKIEDLMKNEEVGTPFDLIINIEDPLKTINNDLLQGTQQFRPPMDLIDEICSPKEFCFGLESTKNTNKPLLLMIKSGSKFFVNDSSIGQDNYQTKDTEHHIEQDQLLIEELRNLIEKKEALIEELKLENQKVEEQLKETKTTLNQTRKDNSRRLKSIQKEYEREIEGIKDVSIQKRSINYLLLFFHNKSYEEQITHLKNHYENELKKKDEEYEILSALLGEKQPETARRIEQSISNEYEQVIKNMKEEFEEQIEKLNAYYQKKLLSYEQETNNFDEKTSKYVKEITDLQAALKEARVQARASSREQYSTGSYRNSSTDRSTVRNNGNINQAVPKPATTARGSSLESIRALQSLIAKINKYFDSDPIESEITPLNRKNVYAKVSKLKTPNHRSGKENAQPNVPHKTYHNHHHNFACDESSIDQLTNASFDEETAKLFNNSIKNLNMNNHLNFNPSI